MERPQLGQWCLISAIATKRKSGAKIGKQFRRTESRWACSKLEKPLRAMFIGYRTVSDCVFDANDFGGDEYEETIENYNHQEVWLFVYSDRRNLIRVFPKDAQLIESGE